VQLSADIRSLDVVQGEKPWHRARLVLLQYEGKSARYTVPHVAAVLEGTHEWENHKAVFEIQPWATELTVAAQLVRCTGSLEVKNIRLYPVVESKVYTWAQRLIIGSWGVFFCLSSGVLSGERKIWDSRNFDCQFCGDFVWDHDSRGDENSSL